jgi:uncharacterized peroxidase-related enzyme
VTHHRRSLRRLLKDDALLARIEADYETAGLDERRLAMLRYVEKLTKTPWEMVPSDLAPLREAGFSDTDILQIVEVASYYAYVNRIADGLGVSLEPWVKAEEAG